MLKKRILSTTASLTVLAVLAACTSTGNPATAPSDAAASSAAPASSAAASSAAPATAESSAAPVASSAAPASPASSAAASSAAPSATATTAPKSETGGTSDIKERATFNGTVYDAKGSVLDGVKVSAKSVDPTVSWVGQEQDTLNGSYVFQNAPVGVRVEITAKKAGFTIRTQTVVLKSNLIGSPDANVYDFGGARANAAQYALQDEPEITMLKVNGQLANNAGPNVLNAAGAGFAGGVNLTSGTSAGMSGVDNSKLEVEMTFSEPVDVESVKSNFRIYSENNDSSGTAANKIRNATASFVIDDGYGSFTTNSDNTVVKFTANKPLYTLNTGTSLRYKLTFANGFKDTSGKQADTEANKLGYIKYSASLKKDFLVFSLANDDTAFKLESVTATDNLNDEDRINLNFNKSLDVYVKRSIPALDSASASINLANAGFQFKANGNKGEVWYQPEAAGAAQIKLGTFSLFRNPTSSTNTIAFGSYALKNYEFLNSGKTLSLRLDRNAFVQSDRIFVEIEKLQSPAGKDISTDNSGDSSIGGGQIVSTNDSKKVGAVN